MEQFPIDLMTVFALSDRSHARDRELWRGFLALVIPYLIETDPLEVERTLDRAIVSSPDEVLDDIPDRSWTQAKGPEIALRWLSAALAEELDLPREMGLAAFVECNLPTRIVPIGKGALVSEQTLVTSWLSKFSKRQKSTEFANRVIQWKKYFEASVQARGLTHEQLISEDVEDTAPATATGESAAHEPGEGATARGDKDNADGANAPRVRIA